VAPTGSAALLFESTGKTSGAEERQLTVFVRSLTNGAAENVPTARKFPVSCKLPTVIVLGIIMSESKFAPDVPPPEALPVTVSVALAPVAPLNAIPPTVIVVVPTPTAVATPEALMVATEGTLEVQITPLVKFCVEGCFALPYVPTAVNCAV
jgi:hypothetical protein